MKIDKKRRIPNHDLNDEFMKEFKKLLVKYKVRYCGNLGDKPYICFADRTYQYFEFIDKKLKISEYKEREI